MRIKELIAYWPVVSMMLLFASLPFGFSNFQRIMLIVFGVSYVLDYLVFFRWKGWKWSKEKLPYLFCILFFLLIPIWHLFEETTYARYYHIYVEARLPFLAYGVIGIMGLNDKYRIRDFAVVAILTSILMIICSIYGYYHGLGGFFYLPEITLVENMDAYRCWSALTVNAHMTYNLFLNMTLIFIFYLWRAPDISPWRIRLSYLSLFFIIPSICVSLGRTGLMTMILLFLAYFVLSVWMKVKNHTLLVLALLALPLMAYVALPQFSGREANKDPRTVIWRFSEKVISKKPLLGYGPAAARETFVNEGLQDEDFYNNYVTGYVSGHPIFDGEGNVDLTQMHPHNMFLGTIMEFGVIGVCLLIACLISPFLYFKRERRLLFLAMFVFAFFMQGLFESIGPHLLPTFLMLELLLWNYAVDACDFSFGRKR